MLRMILILCISTISFTRQVYAQSKYWLSENGQVSFISKAPLETIKAESHTLKGVLDLNEQSFAFTILIGTFEGFNSEIQRTHFQENYMEFRKFPKATFTGKLIEDIPFSKPGTYQVRAKGILDIHGHKIERIIKGALTIGEKGGTIRTEFSVPLSDHGITIPKIVEQKIAEEIQVTVELNFAMQTK